jgi:putative nucleotidyltransferase with HDIG domain
MSSLAHLTRRFRGSLSREEPAAGDVEWAQRLLLPREASLWNSMAVQDRRHSIEVARRFLVVAPEATPAEMAGALLHDVGKTVSSLGTFNRVIATVVGPCTERFRQYHDHERLGADLLREAGSDTVTVELVQGRGPHADALRRADDV